MVRIQAEDYRDKVGVARMGEFQSEPGVVITPEHEYELRAEYNTTTSSDSDAMAIFYLYLLEKDFHRPTDKNLQARKTDRAAIHGGERVAGEESRAAIAGCDTHLAESAYSGEAAAGDGLGAGTHLAAGSARPSH